jgi:WD40 repeat protein
VATLSGFIDDQTGNAVFSPDGRTLALSDSGKQAVMLWDTKSWQQVFALASGVPWQLGISPDGNTIGAMTEAGDLHLWRAPDWDEINSAEAREKAELRKY